MPEKKSLKRRCNNIRVGDFVEVQRDVQRVPNPTNAEERETFYRRRRSYYYAMMDGRPTCAPPCAVHQPYAKAGEVGEVIGFATGNGREPQPQVRMNAGGIKTFRDSSLKRVEGSGSPSRP